MQNSRRVQIVSLCSLVFIQNSMAADFNIAEGETQILQQLLQGNEIGGIDEGGHLQVEGIGIKVEGLNNQINNAGLLSTRETGEGDTIIDSSGDNLTISNSGKIHVYNKNSTGIRSTGDQATILISGQLSLEPIGDFQLGFNDLVTGSTGIYSEGDDVTIDTQGGHIVSEAADSTMIVSKGANANINNVNITSYSQGTTGIDSSGANAKINIDSIGILPFIGGLAVRSSGDNSIINSKRIFLGGHGATGIKTSGKNVLINITGSIESDGSAESTTAVSASGQGTIINNKGKISGSSERPSGILAFGDDSTVTNSGLIDLWTLGGVTIGSYGDNNKVINTGNLNSGGSLSTAIDSKGLNAKIVNSGTINSEGNQSAIGINSTGDAAQIVNNGAIELNKNTNQINEGVAIASSGRDVVITNNGQIKAVGGRGGIGISSSGVGAAITNAGELSTEGAFSFAIRSLGDHASISNNDNLIVKGHSSSAIHSEGLASTLINKGTIISQDTSLLTAPTIFSKGEDTMIINQGNIINKGSQAVTIASQGDFSTIVNSGSVSLEGAGGSSILSTGKSTTINNTGVISATNGGSAIHAQGADTTINNEGELRTTGRANTIEVDGKNTVINNSGLISATGTDAYAIKVNGDKNVVLNILPGSEIIGRVDLGGRATEEESNSEVPTPEASKPIPGAPTPANRPVVNNQDHDVINLHALNGLSGVSRVDTLQVDLANIEEINYVNGSVVTPAVVVGQTLNQIDATMESTRGVALANLSSSIHEQLNKRMVHKPAAKAVLWSEALASKRTRDSEGNALAYDHDQTGIAIGYERNLGATSVGITAGAVHSRTGSEIDSFVAESDSYYGGVYAQAKLGKVDLNASLIGGYNEYDNRRTIMDNANGREVADADFSGQFVSPSVTISSTIEAGESVEIRPSAQVNYSHAWLDDYQETGSTNGNLRVDSRNVHALAAKLQVGVVKALSESSELEFRVGAATRHTSDKNIDVNLRGTQFSYAHAGDDSVTGAYLGLNLRLAEKDNLSMEADIELGSASGGETYASGQLKLEYRF